MGDLPPLPDEVWADPGRRDWYFREKKPDSVARYIRADLYDARTSERDEWKDVARRAGVCMTCAIRAPEPYGCTDCLNTGWKDGAPAGFVDESLFKEIREENKEMREALTDIAKSDDIENCLDPQRNKRIASATIAKSTGAADG